RLRGQACGAEAAAPRGGGHPGPAGRAARLQGAPGVDVHADERRGGVLPARVRLARRAADLRADAVRHARARGGRRLRPLFELPPRSASASRLSLVVRSLVSRGALSGVSVRERPRYERRTTMTFQTETAA